VASFPFARGLSRRLVLAGGAAAAAWPALAGDMNAAFTAIEGRVGGTLGLSALDLSTARRITHRAGDYYPMCSTFKLMAVAALLARVDRGEERLDRFVRYGPGDLLSYAPVTRAHVGDGGMRLDGLCAAAIEQSDNTAANLILAAIGGPRGWTRYVRALGDTASLLDRTEPALNDVPPGQQRDATTPGAMLENLHKVLAGGALSELSRNQLGVWMVACRTGLTRLRAGLPAAWRVGDKTGTGDSGASGDLAIAWTPGGAVLISAYMFCARSTPDAVRDAGYAEAARIVAQTFRGTRAHG